MAVAGLTVACVLRSGGRYTAEWVEKLQRGVARHTTTTHRFVCLSDVPVPCQRIPLETDWPGWYAKVELFRPGLFAGPVVYLDLDTIITGDVAALARDRLTMVRDFLKPECRNSGVMAWRGENAHIWRAMHADAAGAIAHYDAWPGGRIGDQAFIEDQVDADTFPPGLVVSFRRDCGRGVSPGAVAVSFHGRRKPPDLLNIEWVRAEWTQ